MCVCVCVCVCACVDTNILYTHMLSSYTKKHVNPLNTELNPICQ